jgi:glutathione synthase
LARFGREVSVFYFRDGYLDTHYTPEFWKLRETIEKSAAIKCPDVFTQITNLKYFQFMINKKETWEHFGFDEATYKKNKKSFCDIFTFEDFDNCPHKMIEHIETSGGWDSFVLKPQKEGGANNYFGLEIKEMLEKSTIDELQSHILMQRIHPTVNYGLFTKFRNRLFLMVFEHR